MQLVCLQTGQPKQNRGSYFRRGLTHSRTVQTSVQLRYGQFFLESFTSRYIKPQTVCSALQATLPAVLGNLHQVVGSSRFLGGFAKVIGRGVLDQLLHVGHTTGDNARIDGHSGLLAVSRLSRLGFRLSQFSDSPGTTRRNTQPEDPLAEDFSPI